MVIKSATSEKSRYLGELTGCVQNYDDCPSDDEQRRLELEQVINYTLRGGNTDWLVHWLAAGQELIDMSAKHDPPGKPARYPPDLELVVPQRLLSLIAAILSGRIETRFRPKGDVDKFPGGYLRERFLRLQRDICAAHENADKRSHLMRELRIAGWSKPNWPETKGQVSHAAKLLLAHHYGLSAEDPKLEDDLRKSPKRPKREPVRQVSEQTLLEAGAMVASAPEFWFWPDYDIEAEHLGDIEDKPKKPEK